MCSAKIEISTNGRTYLAVFFKDLPGATWAVPLNRTYTAVFPQFKPRCMSVGHMGMPASVNLSICQISRAARSRVRGEDVRPREQVHEGRASARVEDFPTPLASCHVHMLTLYAE